MRRPSQPDHWALAGRGTDGERLGEPERDHAGCVLDSGITPEVEGVGGAVLDLDDDWNR